MSTEQSPAIVTVLPLGGRFAAPEDKDLITSMLAQGVAFLAYGCRRGNCGRCRARVVDGDYRHHPFNSVLIDAEQEAQGQVLPCQTFAQSNLSLTQEA